MTHKSTRPWTATQLIHLSSTLASAYGIALERPQAAGLSRWSPQQLIEMSRAKSLPFN